MTGFGSFLMGIVIVLASLAISLGAAWRQSQKRSLINIFLCVLFGLCSAATVVSTSLNILYMHRMRALRADDIEAVVVGGVRISDREALTDIAPCFAEATWFGGLRRARQSGLLRPFEIVRRDGSREQWNAVAWGDGAAIDFGAQEIPLLRPARGWAYVACLPNKLRPHDIDFR